MEFKFTFIGNSADETSAPSIFPIFSNKISLSNFPLLKLFVTASPSCSLTFALFVSFFALIAFPIIPLSPVSVAIVIPANIKSTIIVITKAINVIIFFFIF